MTVLLVLVGGAAGASGRYLVDRWVQARHASGMPWGILVVNVAGSLLLGLVAGLASAPGGGLPAWVPTLVGTGLCGALTTYSTFAFDTVVLARRRAWGHVLLNVGLSLALGLAACSLGWWGGVELTPLL